MRVLVVDARSPFHHAFTRQLRSNGVVADGAEQGAEAVELARSYDYDAVLADMALPDIDGFELIRRLRATRVDTPVILLANHVRAQARIKAFTLGADDVVVTPCDHDELIARVQAVVRRNKGYSQPTLQCGPLQLDLHSHDVRVAGRPVRLTGKEYEILELLVLRRGMVLTKEAFLNHLYGGIDEPEMKIIDVFICKLRRKLAEAGAPDVIGTVWGRGYVIRDPGKHPTRPAVAPRPAPVAAVPAPVG